MDSSTGGPVRELRGSGVTTALIQEEPFLT
ncbi:MAG: hypothetical protein K0R83_2637, partial [Caulobacter sp.]|nr:hypothetical protein [Caulobacter sp.]